MRQEKGSVNWYDQLPACGDRDPAGDGWAGWNGAQPRRLKRL
jgi:hypothetical protein